MIDHGMKKETFHEQYVYATLLLSLVEFTTIKWVLVLAQKLLGESMLVLALAG